ncbi:hypothetical protein AOLI_G00176440 [Acnodon oligacanthus]
MERSWAVPGAEGWRGGRTAPRAAQGPLLRPLVHASLHIAPPSSWLITVHATAQHNIPEGRDARDAPMTVCLPVLSVYESPFHLAALRASTALTVPLWAEVDLERTQSKTEGSPQTPPSSTFIPHQTINSSVRMGTPAEEPRG